MHHRIIAFFISGSSPEQSSYRRAVNHLQELADSFSRKISYTELGKYHLHLVYEGDMEKLLIRDGGNTSFCVGPHTARKKSGWEFSFEDRRNIRGRFLHVSFEDNKISISNDFGGSIPVYYSLRNSLAISNIEPLVVLDSDSSYGDLSPEAVYGLFRYTHLIDTETFYRHIKTQQADTTYIYRDNIEKPEIRYNQTVRFSEERSNMTDAEAVAELYEINRMLVQESISEEEDIIVPLSSGHDSRIILAAASENKDIRSRLRCYTYTPNMSLETRPAKEICKRLGVSWERIQLPTSSFDMQRLKQVAGVFGSSLHFHSKYQLDFIGAIKNSFIPGKSIIASGFMTGVGTGNSFVCDMNIKNENIKLADAVGKYGISKYLGEKYLSEHSRVFKPEMKSQIEDGFRKSFDRFDGPLLHRSMMLDVWARQRNFYSHQPRIVDWEMPYVGPHVSPEFFNLMMSLPTGLLMNRKGVEMMLSKYYPKISDIASNSHLTFANILKRSLSCPRDGMMHYAPLLLKYFFKQKWILPGSLASEMKDPAIPDLRCIGKDGLFPIFDLNIESRQIFDEYFDCREVDNLFNCAMTGNELAAKRLTILESLAYALKMLEK